MSDKFRDAWAGWRGKEGDVGIGVASVDLREQRDSYTLRLNLPGRDLSKVEVRLDSDTLHVVAPATAKAPGYEQTFVLADVLPNERLEIDRRQKDNLIVVTVPKSSGVTQAVPRVPLRPPSTAPLGNSDDDIFTRMENISRDLDRIVDESLKEIGLTPEQEGYFDEPRFGSSIDLQDEGTHYTLRAYLPGRTVDDVKATLEGQTLRIEAKAEEAVTGDKGTIRSHKAAFVQIVTLPGPVKAEAMKVDKKENMLVVSLPKS